MRHGSIAAVRPRGKAVTLDDDGAERAGSGPRGCTIYTWPTDPTASVPPPETQLDARSAASLRPTVRSRQAPFAGPDRRPGSGRRAEHAQGDRVQRRGPRQADRRRRDELDRDDALQLQPPPP